MQVTDDEDVVAIFGETFLVLLKHESRLMRARVRIA